MTRTVYHKIGEQRKRDFGIIFSAMSRRANIIIVAVLAAIHYAANAAEVEIRAVGTWAVDGVTALVKVKASSLVGGDLSGMHWCVCNAAGKVVLDWKRPHGGITRTAQLKINLPPGEYSLRATDGTQFCGNVPVRVLPSGNRHARAVVAIREPPDPAAESGAKRFWRDMMRGEFSQAETLPRTPRRIVARFCAAFPDRIDDLGDFIERIAADMKSAGENALICPAEWNAVPDHLSALCAKFDEEGLMVFPSVDRGRGLQRKVDAIVDAGAQHRSFGGICVRVNRHDAVDANERKRLERDLPSARMLWVLSDADLEYMAHPLLAGDAVALAVADKAPVQFVQAFRALPAVAFADIGGQDGKVRLRHAEYNGTSWFYVFNSGTDTVRVNMEMPIRARDLARDERVGSLFGASKCEFILAPGELRSFSAPEGARPRIQ